MRCSSCGGEVIAPSSLCPSCEARLSGERPETLTSTTALPQLNASDIVLMFGDRFAAARDEGYKIPCSEVEVSVSSLVVTAITAALASLFGDGLISLAKGQKKGFLFKSEAVVVNRVQDPATPKAGLEGKVLSSLTGDVRKDTLRDIVRRALGQSTMDPYTVLLSYAMDHCHKAGFFVEDEKAPPIVRLLAGKTVATPLRPLCDRIAAMSGEVPAVQSLLSDFQARQTDLFALIGKDIKKSIDSAYLQS